MTPLLLFWFVLLAMLVGIVIYAYQKSEDALNAALLPEETPSSFADFIATELTRMTGHFSRGMHHARPHGERVVLHGTILLQKGHDLFIEKIFGRMDVEKGNVTSFFLKRIAEHKESLRGKKRGKM